MEAQGRYIDALTHSDDPLIKEMFDKLTSLRREIAGRQISGAKKIGTGPAKDPHKANRIPYKMGKEAFYKPGWVSSSYPL